jgi:H+/gluconate symporter-like permease
MIKNTNIILLILVLGALLFLYNKQENFTMTEQSNEAVQNIASVYADTSGTVSFNNVNITGKIYSPTQKIICN